MRRISVVELWATRVWLSALSGATLAPRFAPHPRRRACAPRVQTSCISARSSGPSRGKPGISAPRRLERRLERRHAPVPGRDWRARGGWCLVGPFDACGSLRTRCSDGCLQAAHDSTARGCCEWCSWACAAVELGETSSRTWCSWACAMRESP